MDPGGIEPPTLRLSSVRSNQLSYGSGVITRKGLRHLQTSLSVLLESGADQDRTGDLLLAKQALSQLSYSPIKKPALKLRLIVITQARECLCTRGIDLFSLSCERKNKGGDPAARSRTATLLRLHPNHWSQLGRLLPLRVRSPFLVAPNFRGVTGGVYKARERIHRSQLISDY